MATQTTTPSSKYYCCRVINNACKTGFSSLSAYNKHKKYVHIIPQQLGGAGKESQGTHFKQHPVIDGMSLVLVQSIICTTMI